MATTNKKTPAGTIDITPTWKAVLPVFLIALQHGNAVGQRVAMEELRRMADFADRYVESAKKEAEEQADAISDEARLLEYTKWLLTNGARHGAGEPGKSANAARFGMTCTCPHRNSDGTLRTQKKKKS